MRFRGTHRIAYAYDRPVFLEAHTIRLRPRTDPRQTLRTFDLRVKPEPDGIAEGVDAFGNVIALAWFSGTHEALEFETQFEVVTGRPNPFDYVLPDPALGVLPMRYAGDVAPALAAYVAPSQAPDEVQRLAEDVAKVSGRELQPFLSNLTARINELVRTVIRPEGDPLPVDRTLRGGVGSCRDVAVVFVEACRVMGVASRFVSGYQSGAPDGDHELHAWAGAYIPGVGWRGYDPTTGLAVADEHVTLAAAPTSPGAAPTTGAFRGDARASMRADVHLEISDA